MIGIIDYGCGNIHAFTNAFKRMNIDSLVVSKPEHLSKIKKIILPGVGSFDHVIKCFNASGLRDMVEKKIFIEKINILGICAGMQIFADSSEEGSESGLGWVSGTVKKFDNYQNKKKLIVPHMGWNSVSVIDDTLFKGVSKNPRFYFVHSFYFENKESNDIAGETSYGRLFSCAVRKKNIFGVQFHPEKSHQNGQVLLKNFVNL